MLDAFESTVDASGLVSSPDFAWDFWDWFEGWLEKLAGKDDIFYGTNSEVLLSDRWQG